MLTNLFPPDALGGYELLADDVVKRLRARGHVVSVITTGSGERSGGVARILRLARAFGTPPARDRARHLVAAARNRAKLERWLDATPRPDAVLVMSMRRLGLEPARVYAERGVPLVWTVNDDWPSAFAELPQPRDLRGRVARWVDAAPIWRHTWRSLSPRHVVYLSKSIREIVQRDGAPLPSGIVCAQGVDLARFVRRPFRPIGASPRLLFVGRLHPSKAPDVAIDTLAALRRRGVDARLAMAGAAVTPAYERELRALAEARGVEAHVAWLGHVERERVPALYADADVLLYPLRGDIEAQGLTYMEAIASGLPVAAFPRGGARELLDGHDVVVRAQTCDGDGFADALGPLLASAAAQRALVDRAYEWLGAHASLDGYVGALERELAIACGDRRAPPELRHPSRRIQGLEDRRHDH